MRRLTANAAAPHQWSTVSAIKWVVPMGANGKAGTASELIPIGGATKIARAGIGGDAPGWPVAQTGSASLSCPLMIVPRFEF